MKTALTNLGQEAASPVAGSKTVEDLLDQAWKIHDKASLRVVVAPQREEEVFAPTILESDEFVDNLFSLAHSPNVGLLSYEMPKHKSLSAKSLVIEQVSNSRVSYTEEVRIEVFERGIISVDSNVSGRVDRRGGVGGGIGLNVWVLAEEDIEDAATKALRFVHAVYEYFDKYERHQRFFLGAALSGVGYRSLERNPMPRNSYSFGIIAIDHVVKAPDVRLVSRVDLHRAQAEVERLMTRFRRALNTSRPI